VLVNTVLKVEENHHVRRGLSIPTLGPRTQTHVSIVLLVSIVLHPVWKTVYQLSHAMPDTTVMVEIALQHLQQRDVQIAIYVKLGQLSKNHVIQE